MQQKSYVFVMLSLLLGRYFIAQNMKSACAGTPKATVLHYWGSSIKFNNGIILENNNSPK